MNAGSAKGACCTKYAACKDPQTLMIEMFKTKQNLNSPFMKCLQVFCRLKAEKQ